MNREPGGRGAAKKSSGRKGPPSCCNSKQGKIRLYALANFLIQLLIQWLLQSLLAVSQWKYFPSGALTWDGGESIAICSNRGKLFPLICIPICTMYGGGIWWGFAGWSLSSLSQVSLLNKAQLILQALPPLFIPLHYQASKLLKAFFSPWSIRSLSLGKIE